jgi:DNA-binding CsgD family transcriptional regulator
MKYTSISQREQQVLELIAFEKTSKEIASDLYISDHTVLSHRKNLLEKLDVKNTAGLVRRAFELGLLHLRKANNKS